MIHDLEYPQCAPTFRVARAQFDDVLGTFANPSLGEINPGSGCLSYGYPIYDDSNWTVYTYPNSPYFYRVSKLSCDAAISDVATLAANPDGSGGGTITVTASGTGTLEYRVTRPGYESAWQLSNVFTGASIIAGTYVVRVRLQASPSCEATDDAIVLSGMAATTSKTNETASDQDDGTITVNITSGGGLYVVLFQEGEVDEETRNLNSGDPAQSTFFDNLAAGVYTIKVTDTTLGTELNFEVTITEPLLVVPENNYFNIPRFQSLRAVHTITPDGCTNFETADNTLLCNIADPHVRGKEYTQKVCKCDAVKIQAHANYVTVSALLYNKLTGVLIETFPFEKVAQYTGLVVEYPIIIKNHGSGQSRVYFQTSLIPIRLQAGGIFGVTNNADGFDGNYEILEILEDAVEAKEYLLINLNYTAGGSSSAADGVFVSNVLDFDIWEVTLDLLAKDDGIYYVKFVAADAEGNEADNPAFTEPFSLKVSHPNTNLLKWTNEDNAFNIDYTNNIVHLLRVESRILTPLPGSDMSILRRPSGDAVKTYGKFQDRFDFEFFKLPGYLHRTLAVAFLHDLYFINSVQHENADPYEEPKWIPRYLLANSRIVVELTGQIRTYNGNDLGSADIDDGFLIVNEGFLKL